MNAILKLIFEQWQEDRVDGKAETRAYNRFSDRTAYTPEEINKNEDYLCSAMNEIAERAFLVGFNTAVGLKDLLDGGITKEDI